MKENSKEISKFVFNFIDLLIQNYGRNIKYGDTSAKQFTHMLRIFILCANSTSITFLANCLYLLKI